MSRIAVAVASVFLLLPTIVRGEDRAVHDGSVKSVAQDKLTILDKQGKESTYTVPAGIPVMIHGKASKLEELKSGMLIRVTTGLKGDVASITTVEPLMIVGATLLWR